MSPPKKDRFENVFEAVQAVGTLTFFCLVLLLTLVSDNHSSGYKWGAVIIQLVAIALISFFLTKKWKVSLVLWFLIISAFLAAVFFWII